MKTWGKPRSPRIVGLPVGKAGLRPRSYAPRRALRRLLGERVQRPDERLRAARHRAVIEGEPERDTEREEERPANEKHGEPDPGSPARRRTASPKRLIDTHR